MDRNEGRGREKQGLLKPHLSVFQVKAVRKSALYHWSTAAREAISGLKIVAAASSQTFFRVTRLVSQLT